MLQIDAITLKLDEKQENIPFNDSNSTKSVNNAVLTSMNGKEKIYNF